MRHVPGRPPRTSEWMSSNGDEGPSGRGEPALPELGVGRCSMRVAIVGGGPGGLYAAILLRKLGMDHEVTVWERNAPDDTFGFGVVFSDETLAGFEAADPASYAEITSRFAHWADIDIEYRGQ